MIKFFFSGGPFMWLLLITAITVLVLFIKKAIELYSTKEQDTARLKNGINTIIFWGGISAVLGFFAHFLGIYNAMMVISRASEISPAVIAEGYAVSLTTILFGLTIFIFSAIFWFILNWRYKKLSIR
jgi:biopolymer transport protein ExbB/TolQ